MVSVGLAHKRMSHRFSSPRIDGGEKLGCYHPERGNSTSTIRKQLVEALLFLDCNPSLRPNGWFTFGLEKEFAEHLPIFSKLSEELCQKWVRSRCGD